MEFNLKFDSFMEVQKFIKTKEEREYIQLCITNSRTIIGANKKGVKRNLDHKLKYYEVTYRCIHSGSRVSRSTGKRPKQSTYKQYCPFKLRLKASSDGCNLEVKEFIDEHNHEHNKETYSFLPRQRRLDKPTQELAKHMLQFRANKKLIQADLLLSSTKVTLKDLHNLASTNSTQDTLENAVKYLLQKDSNIVELVKSEDNILLGLFYQDQEMKRVFQCYPEILFVDAIYKVSNLRAGLYIFAVEDGNGETEIVGFFLAINEEYPTILKMVQLFKKHNCLWTKTVSIMSDKDFQERHAFREEFPNASLLICRFHTLRTFKREVSTEKMGITRGERTLCLELVHKIVYARNETEYNIIFEEIKKANIKCFTDYFIKNWHPIRHEWVVSMQTSVTFKNTTNNRLEAVNSKVVQVVKRHSNLPSLFKDLDNLLLSLRTERDSRVARMQFKRPMDIVLSCDDEKKYLQVLTPYAFGLLREQFKLKDKVKFVIEREVDISIVDTVKVESSEGLLTVTSEKCTWGFFVRMELPCKHILKMREIKKKSLFSKTLVAVRWLKSFYIKHSRLTLPATNSMDTNIEGLIDISSIPARRVLSQHQKYRLVSKKIQKLASLASEAPSRTFSQRLKVIEDLIKLWETNTEANVVSVHKDDTITVMLAAQDETVAHTNVVSVHKDDMITVASAAQDETVNYVNVVSVHKDDTITVMLAAQDETVAHTNVVSVHKDDMITVASAAQDETVNYANVVSVHKDDMITVASAAQDEKVNYANVVSVHKDDVVTVASAARDETVTYASVVSTAQNIEIITDARVVTNKKDVQNQGILSNLPLLPPKMKKRGRPKGCDKTVVGLPARKSRTKKVICFERKSPTEKDKIMLNWFVPITNVNNSLCGSLIEETMIEMNPNKISAAALDENINLFRIRKYFTEDGWAALLHIVKIKKEHPLWLCPVCEEDSSNNSICCNSCLEWFHLKCSGLRSEPKQKHWFCRQCHM